MTGQRDLRVCFLGDSLTAGVGDPTGLGWVGRVAAATRRRDIAVTAYNLGIRLDTSADVLARWEQEAGRRLTVGDDRRIVLSIGVNDTTLIGGVPRVRPEQAVRNVRQIVGRAAAAGWGPLVVGPTPVLDHAQNGRIEDLSERFSRACQDLATPYIPMVDRLMSYPRWPAELRRGDGAHPGEAGYRRLAEIVLAHGWWAWLGSES